MSHLIVYTFNNNKLLVSITHIRSLKYSASACNNSCEKIFFSTESYIVFRSFFIRVESRSGFDRDRDWANTIPGVEFTKLLMFVLVTGVLFNSYILKEYTVQTFDSSLTISSNRNAPIIIVLL